MSDPVEPSWFSSVIVASVIALGTWIAHKIRADARIEAKVEETAKDVQKLQRGMNKMYNHWTGMDLFDEEDG